MKKEYDIAFSLGFSCGTSEALRNAGLQFSSYPLDWVAVHDIGSGVRSVVSEFKDWLNEEDMELLDVCHSAGFMTRFYLNRKTNMGFSHEFSDFEPFSKSYPGVRKTYDRRINRLLSTLQASKRILAVWVEPPTHGRVDDAINRAALESLRAKYPESSLDLLAFYNEPGCSDPHAVLDDGGLTVVAADYRKMDGQKIAHFVDTAQFAKYLSARFTVPDKRTAEEKAAFASLNHAQHTYRWGPGKSRFRRWLNQRAYKLFRFLEGILLKKCLVQDNVSLWFWEDLRREAERGAK